MLSIMFQRESVFIGNRPLSEIMTPHTVLMCRRNALDSDGREIVVAMAAFDFPSTMAEVLNDFRLSQPIDGMLVRLSAGYPFEECIYAEVSIPGGTHGASPENLAWLIDNGERVADVAISRVSREYESGRTKGKRP